MPILINDAWSEETLSYAYTVLQREERLPDKLELTILTEDLIENLGSGIVSLMSPSYLAAIRLAGLTEIVDFFVHFGTALWLANFPLAKHMPLSAGEDLRIRRALLYFQLYAQLFHQAETASDRDWEQRHHQEQCSWTRYTSVEVEECKCIYGLLVDIVSYMRLIQNCGFLSHFFLTHTVV